MSRKFVKIKSTARPPEKLVWIKSGPGAHKLAQKFPTMDPEPPAAGSGRVSYPPTPHRRACSHIGPPSRVHMSHG